MNKQMGSENCRVKVILAMLCDFGQTAAVKENMRRLTCAHLYKRKYMYGGGNGRL